MQHTHALKPVRSIMKTNRRYERHVIMIKNALSACGYDARRLNTHNALRKALGTLPKPELERVLARLI